MKHLSLRYKFLLILTLLCLPTAIATIMLSNVSTRSIHFAEREMNGARYLQPLSELQQLIGTHHVTLLNGPGAQPDNLNASQNSLREKMAEIAAMNKRLGAQLGLEQTWPKVLKTMTQLGSLTPEMPYEAREETHQHVLQALDQHTRMIGDQSNLILDPDLDS